MKSKLTILMILATQFGLADIVQNDQRDLIRKGA